MTSTAGNFKASLAAMLGICLAFMLIALNTSVVGTAMPAIVADLRGYDLYQWAASAFLVGNAVMIPLTGRLGDLYGRKPFVLASVFLFACASVACGLSQTMLQLVLARACQGVAGGMLLGVASACVPDLFPAATQRVRWQVLLSSSYGVALAIGPWLGGWLTEHTSWRWVFFVNLPVALAALPTVAFFFPHIVHHDSDDKSIDWLGAALMAVAVGGLLAAAEFAQGHGLWSATSLALWLGTGLASYVFFRHQYRTRAPIIPPVVLDNTAARQLMALGVLTGLTMFMLIFYTPLLLQGSFGQSPHEAGIVMTPLLVCITLGSILNGRLLPRLKRAERLIAWGQLGTLLSCVLMAQLQPDTPRALLMLAFGLCGASFGFQLPNLTMQLMAVAGRSHLGVAGALAQTTRMVGNMVGVGLASVLVNTLYARSVQQTLDTLQLYDPALTQLLATPQVLVRQEDQRALQQLAAGLGADPAALLQAAKLGLLSGTHAAFWMCAAVSAVAMLISLRLPHYDLRRH